MSEMLPDIPDAPSGWSTDNHYFYEICNRNGKTVSIQLALSAKNASDEFLAKCERINEFTGKSGKEHWQWRVAFRTKNVEIGEELDKKAIFSGLDACFDEILAFEVGLGQKLQEA